MRHPMSSGTPVRGLLAWLTLLAVILGGCATTNHPQDAAITAQVKALLEQHPELRVPNVVYVQTLHRVVYLTGQVSTDLQRQTAEAAARRVAGRRVVNNISLSYTGR